jgi:hypothetical protein
VAKGWIAAFVAVYFSPSDIIFKAATRKGPLHTIVTVYETIDGTTGIMNSFTKAAGLFKQNSVAPWIAGLV